MKLNTDRLNAFYQVALDKNFSISAENLCITQSALSQRVLKLEQELKTKLFIRDTTGIALTEAGSLLFDYVSDLQQRENEVVNALTGQANTPSGIIRVAAFSSVLRSVVMPALSPLIKGDASGNVEVFSRELRELPYMLKSGEADFIVHDNPKLSGNLIAVELGQENLVHVRSAQGLNQAPDKSLDMEQICFLDHDVDDMTTYHFFAKQNQNDIEIRRSFYDDIYGILDGVRLGFGEAIVSEHLVANDPQIEIVPHANRVTSPVILYYQKSRYLTKLQDQVIEMLKRNACGYLNSSK